MTYSPCNVDLLSRNAGSPANTCSHSVRAKKKSKDSSSESQVTRQHILNGLIIALLLIHVHRTLLNQDYAPRDGPPTTDSSTTPHAWFSQPETIRNKLERRSWVMQYPRQLYCLLPTKSLIFMAATD